MLLSLNREKNYYRPGDLNEQINSTNKSQGKIKLQS